MKAKSSLLTVSQDEINWAIENSIHTAICDYNTERMNLLEKGAQQNAIASAKNLLKMDLLTPEQISQAVSLPLEQVRDLQKELEAEKVKN